MSPSHLISSALMMESRHKSVEIRVWPCSNKTKTFLFDKHKQESLSPHGSLIIWGEKK